MFYVYILASEADVSNHYTGITRDLAARLAQHNAGECAHTSKFRPWRIETAVSFRSEGKAIAFEKDLKAVRVVSSPAAIFNSGDFLGKKLNLKPAARASHKQ